MCVDFGGRVGHGHEQRIIQGLRAALRQERMHLAARHPISRATSDIAILFYRVASRLDVRDVLQQAQA